MSDYISREKFVEECNRYNGLLIHLMSKPEATARFKIESQIKMSVCDTLKEIAEGMDYIDVRENKGEWIPVSERLPEKNVWVLVTVEKSGKCFQEIMRRSNYFEAWIDDIDYYTDEIIAWQPLPEPYKAESEDK